MLVTVALLLLLALLFLSVPVAAVLLLLGLLLSKFFSPLPLEMAMGEIAWSTNTDFVLVAIPLYVLLGELLLRSGIAAKTYQALNLWLSWLPGGLMHANIVTSALFAATSGSSVATAATVGTVALPEARRYRYDERLFAGTIAAGGTLGILIPPSINMIIYGFLTDTSIPRLYLAGFIPGALLALLFMLTVVVATLLRPERGGVRQVRRITARDRWQSLGHLLPPLFLFLVVIGSIYAGIATPTESAALGVLAALGLAAANRRLSLRMLATAIAGTMRTTAMIMLIITSAYFLNFVLASIGLTDRLTAFVRALGWTPFETLLAVIALYVVLGLFMETLSIMITTIPVITPVMFALGYDPVWFGVLLMILIEMALITPPIGLNLYVVQGVRRRGTLQEVIVGTLPFVVTMALMVAVLIAFPQLALFLPRLFS